MTLGDRESSTVGEVEPEGFVAQDQRTGDAELQTRIIDAVLESITRKE